MADEELEPPRRLIVLYRWRSHPGAEDAFVEAWSRMTGLLRFRGSLGSRLHRGDDGLWYGYAQWPSAKVREDAFANGSPDAEASARIKSSIAERFPEVVLYPVSDYLVPLDNTPVPDNSSKRIR